MIRHLACLAMPLCQPRWWLAALLAGASLAIGLALGRVDVFDTAWADRIVASNPRPVSPTTARVVLDPAIPLAISREQALTLEALAVERLAAMQARAVVFDGQITLRNLRQQRFAACLPGAGQPLPLCSLLGADACFSMAGRQRLAPLDVDADARRLLRMPPPLSDRAPPPYSLLYGLSSPPRLVSPELPSGGDGVVRAAYVGVDRMLGAGAGTGRAGPACDGRGDCLPLRFNDPQRIGVLPLSALAACDERTWRSLAGQVAGREVVLQLTDESTTEDVHPITGNALRTGGSIIEAGLATRALDDGPREPPWAIVMVMGAILLGFTIAVCAYLRGIVGMLLLSAELALAYGLAPRLYPYAYWPVTALLAGQALAAACIYAGHLYLRTQHMGVLARFLPAPVRHRLLVGGPGNPQGTQLPALVLMSDLAGYVGLTDRLGAPSQVFALMNDYLDTVSQDMQERHGAWLESYTGDAVCYYWPRLPDAGVDEDQWRRQALMAAMAIMTRQHAFFAALPQRLPPHLPPAERHALAEALYAGIALVEGEVCMGEIGPRQGIRKFGILGDPLNLAARIESLTRHFQAHLLVTDALVPAARALGLLPRRLATIALKGRPQAMVVWALHHPEEGVQASDIEQWDRWQAAPNGPSEPPAHFARDAATLRAWHAAGWWDEASASFRLETK